MTKASGYSKILWKATTLIVWLGVIGMVGGVAIYLWSKAETSQIEQVQQLRKEMNALTDRDYQLQHKIDSLNRLGVADLELLEDTTSVNTVAASPR